LTGSPGKFDKERRESGGFFNSLKYLKDLAVLTIQN